MANYTKSELEGIIRAAGDRSASREGGINSSDLGLSLRRVAVVMPEDAATYKEIFKDLANFIGYVLNDVPYETRAMPPQITVERLCSLFEEYNSAQRQKPNFVDPHIEEEKAFIDVLARLRYGLYKG